MQIRQVRRIKVALLVSSLVCLAFLLLAAFEEQLSARWRTYQMAYAIALEKQNRESGVPVTAYPIEHRQVYLEDLGRVDRCVTCHVGVDNPMMKEKVQPLTTHPGDLLEHHPADRFGCTICHQGQGRATVAADAHGEDPHWPEPLLRGDMVFTSCGRCHYENDLYGGEADLYGRPRPIEQIREGELATHVPGADQIASGKQLVIEKGCLGCHTYRGRGGTLGPDITHVGDKTAHEFDFSRVDGERTVTNWMFAHFKSPTAVVASTVMPDMELSDEEALQLAAYMTSLKRKSAPAAYTPLPQPVDSTPVRGETLYRIYCSACHGADGVGAIVRTAAAAHKIDRPRELITPSLRNADTLAVSSDEYLREIISHGRVGTSMLAWQVDGGLSADEIELLIGFIRSWVQPAADRSLVSASRGNARYGAALYRSNCTGCHSVNGQGGEIGISLRSPTFLSVASDEFLADTILHGRANTAMPAWQQFDNREVSDLLAHLRSWQPLRSDRAEVLAAPVLNGLQSTELSVATGKKLYRRRCAVCHGADGRGAIGPSLNNESVLRVVSNEYLHDTIVRGRPGTAMPAWRQLGSEDVVDLISLLRSWQTEPSAELTQRRSSGDWQHGSILFQGMCASCHGPSGEGAIGPQLANPVFLDTATDAMLFEWIGHGRAGTQMRPFLKGEHGTADLSEAQIDDIIAFLRYQRGRRTNYGQRIGLGFAPRGKAHYEQLCASCHGAAGIGASGPAISNPTFLAAATDGYLRATIVLGREGTEMRAMGHGGAGIVELGSEEINDLVAYLRNPADRPGIGHRFVLGANPRRGEELYGGFCAGCHGTDGTGGFAPELNNPNFLRAATDGYLQATVIRGRRGTAMRSFGRVGHGLAELSQRDINDVVSYLRQWSPDTRPLRRTEPFPSPTVIQPELALDAEVGNETASAPGGQ